MDRESVTSSSPPASRGFWMCAALTLVSAVFLTPVVLGGWVAVSLIIGLFLGAALAWIWLLTLEGQRRGIELESLETISIWFLLLIRLYLLAFMVFMPIARVAVVTILIAAIGTATTLVANPRINEYPWFLPGIACAISVPIVMAMGLLGWKVVWPYLTEQYHQDVAALGSNNVLRTFKVLEGVSVVGRQAHPSAHAQSTSDENR